jgi:hypothetical protein
VSDELSECTCDEPSGAHVYPCPAWQPECTCYELAGGAHMMGCYFYGRTAAESQPEEKP